MLNANAIVTVDGVRRYARVSDTHIGTTLAVFANGRLRRVPETSVEMLAEPVRDLPTPTLPVMVMRVTEPFTVQRSGQTACNYSEFEIQSGDYPVSWVTIDHQPIRDGQEPYYGRIVCQAINTREYWVSSAFGRTLGVDDTSPMTETTYTLSPYAYDVDPARNARYVEITPSHGEVYPD